MLIGGPSFDTVKETEWPPNMRVFEDISDTWGPFQIDLFTSRLNIRFLTTSHGSQILRKLFTWIGLTFTVFLHSVWLPHAHKRFYNSTKQWDKFWCSAVIYNSATPSDTQTDLSSFFDPPTNTTPQRCSASLAKATSATGLQSLLQNDILGKATEIILHSWSAGT